MTRNGTILLLILSCTLALAQPPGVVAEWPLFRHDRARTGRSSGHGGLVTPQKSWELDLRGHRYYLKVEPGEGSSLVTLGPGASAMTDELKREFGILAPWIDLEGNGQLRPPPPAAAKILPNVPGFQHPERVGGGGFPGATALIAHEGGKRREVWRSPEYEVYVAPNHLVVDADGDGQLDIVSCPHYQLLVFEGASGEVAGQLRWHEGRNYGHLIAKNLDQDPALEFILQADMQTHIDVIDYDGKDLSLLWRWDIDSAIERKNVFIRPVEDNLRDLDGDGRLELVTNVYNSEGDGRWHLLVLDALTGRKLADLVDRTVAGFCDIDQDGKLELMVSSATGFHQSTGASLTLRNLREGRLETRWSLGSGRWLSSRGTPPAHVATTMPKAERVPVVDAATGAVYLESTSCGMRRYQKLRLGGKPRQLWSLRFPSEAPAEMLAQLPDGSVVLALESPGPLEVKAQGAVVSVLGVERTAPEQFAPGSLLAADLGHPDGLTTLVAEGGRQVLALDSSSRVRWRRHGAPTLVAADLSPRLGKEVAFLSWTSDDEGQVVVADASGRTLWERTVKGFPGPLEPWNWPTLTGLEAARLQGKKSDDLVVFARRGMMHSDQAIALGGADGRTLWRREANPDGQSTTWGYGGKPMAAADLNGNGCEDLVSLYPVNLSVVEGRDGRQLLARNGANVVFPEIWAAYGVPTLFDYDGDGSLELTWNEAQCLGLTDTTGGPGWAHQPSAQGYPADLKGEGRYLMAAVRGAEFLMVDPKNGATLESIPLPAGAAAVAVADIDNDGREEAVVGCGYYLAAVGWEQGRLQLQWTRTLPGEVHEIALADLDRDGDLELLAYLKNGQLCCWSD